MSEYFNYPSDFPKIDGYIIGIQFLPKKKRKGYEDQLRDWCRMNPKQSQWPEWLRAWPEDKKRLERSGN